MITRQIMLEGNKLCENILPSNNKKALITIPGVFKGNSASVMFDRDTLTMHSLLMGATGSGKTNLLKIILPQIISNLSEDDVMLVFDSKMDFIDTHRNNDLVITNRFDGNIWNVFMDIVAEGWEDEKIEKNVLEIAELMFSEAIESSSQPFFPRASRDIFAAVLQAMCRTGRNNEKYRIKWLNNRALKEYISKLDAEKLTDFLKHYPDLLGVIKYVGNGTSEQALGVFAELQSVVNKVFSGAFGKNGRLSIRRVVQNRKGRILFVEYDPAHGAALKTSYQMIVDLFLKEALSSSSVTKGNVFLVCDELKMLPRLSYFEDALNFGRSLGISVICGIQSMEQLYEIYGEYGGKNIVSGFQTTFCFCTHDEETRKYIQGIYGRNLSVIQYSTPSGKIQEEQRQGYCIEDWDLVSLCRGEAIIGLPFEKPFLFKIDKFRG